VTHVVPQDVKDVLRSAPIGAWGEADFNELENKLLHDGKTFQEWTEGVLQDLKGEAHILAQEEDDEWEQIASCIDFLLLLPIHLLRS